MSTPAERVAEVPAFRFDAAAALPAPTVSCIPDDALVVWEYERADLHRRLLAVVVGNRLDLVLVSAGHEPGLRHVTGARILDGDGVPVPQFLTRRALVFWGDTPPGRRGVARTVVLTVATRLVMVRLTGDEAAPEVEVLATLELAR
jgi:hypothetical protein